MKKFILAFAVITIAAISETYAQNYNNWAIGVKVGEPIGINVRRYFDSGTKNFDLNFGTFGLLWGGTRSYSNEPYYAGHAGTMLQGIFHWNKQLGSSEKFQVYYGFGGQINSRKTVPKVSNNIPEKHISLGGVANGGLEYSLPDNDLSIFADFGLYVQIAPKPLFMAIPASLGLRLNLGR